MPIEYETGYDDGFESGFVLAALPLCLSAAFGYLGQGWFGYDSMWIPMAVLLVGFIEVIIFQVLTQ